MLAECPDPVLSSELCHGVKGHDICLLLYKLKVVTFLRINERARVIVEQN